MNSHDHYFRDHVLVQTFKFDQHGISLSPLFFSTTTSHPLPDCPPLESMLCLFSPCSRKLGSTTLHCTTLLTFLFCIVFVTPHVKQSPSCYSAAPLRCLLANCGPTLSSCLLPASLFFGIAVVSWGLGFLVMVRRMGKRMEKAYDADRSIRQVSCWLIVRSM